MSTGGRTESHLFFLWLCAREACLCSAVSGIEGESLLLYLTRNAKKCSCRWSIAVCIFSESFPFARVILIACRLYVLMADIEVARVSRDRIFCVHSVENFRAWEVHVDLLI